MMCKVSKDQSKTVGIARTRYLLPIHFCNKRAEKSWLAHLSEIATADMQIRSPE